MERTDISYTSAAQWGLLRGDRTPSTALIGVLRALNAEIAPPVKAASHAVVNGLLPDTAPHGLRQGCRRRWREEGGDIPTPCERDL